MLSKSSLTTKLWLLLAVTILLSPVEARGEVLTPLAIDWLLEEMQFDGARQAIELFEQENPEDPNALYLRSRYLFMMQELESALEYAELATSASTRVAPHIRAHRDLVRATWEVMGSYQLYLTSRGNFVIHYQERDAVLLPWADETLESAYVELGFDFGYWPPEPVHIHIYPNARILAQVSSLNEEAIETTGTIALSKYNRIMITSPRALVRGYGWLDTLSHEYVHLVIQRITGTRVPIWLHEGLAKFQERRWRGYNQRRLSPSNEHLLAERLSTNELISFEQMHPSMAYLDSQEDSGTAYAQVYTAIEYFYSQYGVEGLRQLVWQIGEGSSVEGSFESITGMPFERWISLWEQHMARREYQRLPSDYQPSLQFMPTEASDAPPDELAGIAEQEARDFMHLGQLLRGRGRVEAAIVEYYKAESLVGAGNPVFQNWLARALLDLGRPVAAHEALEQVAEYYPEYYLTYLHQAEGHLQRSQPDQALSLLLEVASINPFDPDLYRQLSRAYRELGQTDLSSAMEERVRQLIR